MARYEVLLPRSGPVSLVDPTASGKAERAPGGPSFDEILSGRLGAGGNVQLSAEARAAMQTEGIEPTPMLLDRIGRAMDRLADKGGREAVLLDERAVYRVRVPDRVIDSVTPRAVLGDDVITQIDSAALID